MKPKGECTLVGRYDKNINLNSRTFGSNSITLGFNAINNHDRCIVISCSKENEPNTLEFRENGEIYVHGKLIENDKEIVEAFREFLKNSFHK